MTDIQHIADDRQIHPEVVKESIDELKQIGEEAREVIKTVYTTPESKARAYKLFVKQDQEFRKSLEEEFDLPKYDGLIIDENTGDIVH